MAELSLGLPAAMGHTLSFMSYQLVSKPVLDLDTHFKTIVFLLLSMVLDNKVKLKILQDIKAKEELEPESEAKTYNGVF